MRVGGGRPLVGRLRVPAEDQRMAVALVVLGVAAGADEAADGQVVHRDGRR